MKTIVNLALVLFFSMPFLTKAEGLIKPQFPGGDNALVEFLESNLRYPEEAQKQKWEGKSLIAFTINEDGSLTNVRVLKSSQLILDTEALRIVKMMPNWIPASENGIKKKEMVVLPINFDLTRKDLLFK